MEYTNFPSANHTLNKPPSMTDEECGSLRVHSGATREGHPVLVSKWVPNDEELEHLKNGDGVYLIVYGISHPPVMVTAIDPFEPGGFLAPVQEEEQSGDNENKEG